jgi:HlyD family type I secretion membrane fusion protein
MTLSQQIEQSRSQAQALTDQMAATEEQRRLIGDELAAMRDLFGKGLATRSRLLALERAAAALTGQKQEYSGNIDRLKHNVAQLESQINEARSTQQVEVAQEAEDARNRLEEARERQKALRDVLDRTAIRAPVAGYVLDLSVHTIGAVIGRGEKLLEIVPAGATPIIEARASPADGARIGSGMASELRILSPEARNQLPIVGEIRNRSADILTDARTAERYYSVEIAVSKEALAKAQSRPLIPGTPMEVIVPSHSRTVFAYLLDPILDSFRRGLREP